MKHILTSALLICAAALMAGETHAQRVAILHTNDTHSIIDPYHENDLGGVVRRKALIDSVRRAEPNVLLVDAGDVVQGSLYFTLFGGEVEQKMMNLLGYDIQILGNHEFDNGMDALKHYLSGLNAELLATNYDLSATPVDSLFHPYSIRRFGDKKIGFFAINIEPKGLIDSVKSEGVQYLDAVEAANAMAWYLRNVEHVDRVVAISHIGYDYADRLGDVQLAMQTRGIDAVIGGHSHTTIHPERTNTWLIDNLDGKPVAVVQTGKYGANVGELILDLDNGSIDYRLLAVDNRHDAAADAEMAAILAPYKAPVDSILGIRLGRTSDAFDRRPALMNWMADFVKRDAQRLTKKKIDLALVNVGGIRSSFPKGDITQGLIMQTFPFDNYEVVLEISGQHLLETFNSIAATGGNGVSAGVEAVIDPEARNCSSVTINGKPIDPNRTYYVATINYLAAGNDGMDPLRYGTVIAQSPNYLYDDMINAFKHGFLKNRVQKPDLTNRMK